MDPILCIASFRNCVEKEVYNALRPTIANKNKETPNVTETHNHPPLPFIVKNCEFCKKYGNKFATS